MVMMVKTMVMRMVMMTLIRMVLVMMLVIKRIPTTMRMKNKKNGVVAVY
jgi:hypothetical protein